MSVSVTVEWPGSTRKQQAGHPGFRNDDHLWANWVVNMMQAPKAEKALSKVDGAVLLSFNTTDLAPEDVDHAPPADFQRAALALRDLVMAKDARVRPVVDVYRKEWNRIVGKEDGRTEEWFIRDLEDVAAIAQYADSKGAATMTLGYYW